MKAKSNPFLRHLLALVASSAFFSMGSAHAVTFDWTGATDSSFTTGSNWSQNSWGQWSDYQIGGTPTNSTLTIDGYFGIGSLTLQSGLTTDIVINATPGSNPVIMGTDQSGSSATISIASDSSNLTINGEYISSTAVTWNVGAGRTLTIAGQLNNWYNPASIIKNGAGTAVLSSSNGYSGGTTVNGGTLSLAAGGALSSGGGVTIGAGGKLSNDAPAGTSFALNGLTLNGGELAATNAPDTSLGNFYLQGDVTVGGSALSTISADLRVVSNQTRNFNVGATGDPSGVDLLVTGKLGHQNNVAWGYATKSGAGTMKISGTTELGGMTVNAGRLILEDTAIGWPFPVQGLTNNAQLEFSVTSGSRSYPAGIAGSGALFKTGSGTMTLSGSNTYSGGTTINDGTMIASGLGSGAVTIASGATLSTTSASSTGLAALYYNNSIDQGNFANLPALLAHLGGNSPAPSQVNTAASMNFAGNGSGFPAPYNSGGANFEAFYSGKLNITTAGTYTFNTSSDDGSMLFIDGQAVVTNNFFQAVTTRTGSIALTAGMHDIVIAYNQGGGGYGMNAQISGADDTNMVDINTSNASITPDLVVGSLAGAGNIVLSTGNLITGIDNSSTSFTGVISGIGSVTKFGTGVQTLSGANTYSGVTTLQSGVLNIATFSDYGVDGGLGNRASDGSDVGILFRGGSLQYTGATAQTTNRAIRISTLGGATIDASGSSPSATLGFTASSSTNFFENPGNRSLTLTGSNTGDNAFAMAIGEAAGATAVVKSGAGKWVLSGNNSYTGGTTINNGTLLVGRSKLGSGAVVINNGGTLYANDQWVLCGINDHGVAERNIGTLTINAGGTLQLDAVQGFANGATNLYLNGGLVTGGPNNHRGDLYLYNGNEQITAGGATTSTIASVIGLTGNNNTITVDGGSTLNISGLVKNSDWAGNGGGSGGIVKAGSGTLTLTAANTYSGSTTVNGGTLAISADYLNNASTVSIASGAVLHLTHALTDTVNELWIGGVQQSPGVYNVSNSAGFIIGTGSLNVLTGPPADPLLAWINATWPTLSDKTAAGDPDNDGIANLLEYVLQGGDPSTSTTSILPTLDATGANFIFTFFRRAAASGTTQTFEYGTDLSGWTQVAIPGGSGVSISPNTPSSGIDKVEITVAKGVEPTLFGRLRVVK